MSRRAVITVLAVSLVGALLLRFVPVDRHEPVAVPGSVAGTVRSRPALTPPQGLAEASLFVLSDLPPRRIQKPQREGPQELPSFDISEKFQLIGTVITNRKRLALFESIQGKERELLGVGSSLDVCTLAELSANSATFDCAVSGNQTLSLATE